MREPYDIIIAPVVTEKSADQMENNTYSFVVAKDANKIEIGHAVEKLWDVTVKVFGLCAMLARRSGLSWAACPGEQAWDVVLPGRKQSSSCLKATTLSFTRPDDGHQKIQADDAGNPHPLDTRQRGADAERSGKITNRIDEQLRWS